MPSTRVGRPFGRHQSRNVRSQSGRRSAARACRPVPSCAGDAIRWPPGRLRERWRGAAMAHGPALQVRARLGRQQMRYPPARAVVAPPLLRSLPPCFSAPLHTLRRGTTAALAPRQMVFVIPAIPCAQGSIWRPRECGNGRRNSKDEEPRKADIQQRPTRRIPGVMMFSGRL